MSDFDENIHPDKSRAAIRSAGRRGTERGRPPRVALAVGARARRMAPLCPGVSGSPVLESGTGSDCPRTALESARAWAGSAGRVCAGRARGAAAKLASVCGDDVGHRCQFPACLGCRAWAASRRFVAFARFVGCENGDRRVPARPSRCGPPGFVPSGRWAADDWETVTLASRTASPRPSACRPCAATRSTRTCWTMFPMPFRPSCSRPSSSRAIASCSSVKSFPSR